MAEFKRLSDVEVVAEPTDSANVLIEENGVIKKTPKDEIGGGIKVASTAEVGQTIVVKAVDEAGNPTEWECANVDKNYYLVFEGNNNDEAIFITENLYEALSNFINNRRPLNLAVFCHGGQHYISYITNKGDYIEITFISPNQADVCKVYPNNTATLVYDN